MAQLLNKVATITLQPQFQQPEIQNELSRRNDRSIEGKDGG